MSVYTLSEEAIVVSDAKPKPPSSVSPDALDAESAHPPQGPHVVARDLVFQYPSAAEPTLKGLSAEVQPGEFVALCGGNGSGKTTLLRLLGRACARSDTGSDDITVDGVPADDFPDTAFCTQSFDVLNGTVRDNISFGCEWDSLEDVKAAATLAEIAHVIERMPNVYDTVIGRGSEVTLSGGQLARLGLARALCRRPRLLLLDEVTGPLDPTERQVLETLLELKNKQPLTVVLCTHSVTVAASTDRVIILAEGVVAETGPFSQLVAKRGAFFALAKSHLGDVASPSGDTAAVAHEPSKPKL